MFNLMAVVINKQMNKVFYCFDPNFARNISIIAGNIEINIIAIIKRRVTRDQGKKQNDTPRKIC